MDAIIRRRALGRGLGALIPSAYASEDEARDSYVPLAAIRPNPMQPRKAFADEGIEKLAESIRQKGMLQPLLVRRSNGGLELIAGERRLRAAQRLGMELVPVLVRDASDSELLEMALIENIQRENLNPLEEARAYRHLVEEFKLTQEDIATRVGKDRSTIANSMRLLQLPPQVQSQVERGALSAGHARALAAAPSVAMRVELAQEVAVQGLTVRQTEHLVKRRVRPPAGPEMAAAEQRLTEHLGTRVRVLQGRNGCGKIEIEYYSLEGLNGLMDRLTGERS
jgi:ParB family chromosome partitioning protein